MIDPAGRIHLTDTDYARAEQMLAPYRARHAVECGITRLKRNRAVATR